MKDIDHPIVLHIHTIKGRGLPFAEKNKEPWHYNAPFNPETGEIKVDTYDDEEAYSDLTGEYLLEKMKKNPTLVAISSGTPTVMGFNAKRRAETGKQYCSIGKKKNKY